MAPGTHPLPSTPLPSVLHPSSLPARSCMSPVTGAWGLTWSPLPDLLPSPGHFTHWPLTPGSVPRAPVHQQTVLVWGCGLLSASVHHPLSPRTPPSPLVRCCPSSLGIFTQLFCFRGCQRPRPPFLQTNLLPAHRWAVFSALCARWGLRRGAPGGSAPPSRPQFLPAHPRPYPQGEPLCFGSGNGQKAKVRDCGPACVWGARGGLGGCGEHVLGGGCLPQ